MTWEADAACAAEDPALFAEPHKRETPHQGRRRLARAGRICRRCSVSSECFAAGVARNESGVWGGALLNSGRPDERSLLPSEAS